LLTVIVGFLLIGTRVDRTDSLVGEVPLLPQELFQFAADQCGRGPNVERNVQPTVGFCGGGEKSQSRYFVLEVESDAGLLVNSSRTSSTAFASENLTLCLFPYSATFVGFDESAFEYEGITDFESFSPGGDQISAVIKVKARARTLEDLRAMLNSFNVGVQRWVNSGPFLKECLEKPVQRTTVRDVSPKPTR
jgi:hypothetical protein